MARRRLGRGLDGLLPAAPPAASAGVNNNAAIEDVHPSRVQPRRFFNAEGIEELAASIREHGVLEPILVRKRPAGGFEIIAGERRWRASQRAGLKEVPIFVHNLGDGAAFEAALVENLQREDLNPMETARAFQRLIDEYGHTQEAVATKIGKDRSTIANSLRLLKLPKSITELIESGELTEGHGRAILSAPSAAEMKRLAQAAVQKRWSVREVERQARRSGKTTNGSAPAPREGKNANVRDLEKKLSRALGSTVTVHERTKDRGFVRIDYSSLDQLDDIIAKLTKRTQS